MAAFVSRHTESFATAPQIAPHDLAEIAAMGFKTVVNNRPDGEGGAEQPGNAEIEAAAKAAGLHYAYLPVISGQITEQQARDFADLIANSPGPLLAFCRSGARSQNLYQLAHMVSGTPPAA